MPLFGLILFLRFIETGVGLLLVAKNLQSIKVWLVALQLIFMLCGGFYMLNIMGLKGWQCLNIVSLASLLIAYLIILNFRLRAESQDNK
jgi:hypothetical protein